MAYDTELLWPMVWSSYDLRYGALMAYDKWLLEPVVGSSFTYGT